jgi:hypothetical protein
MSRLPYKRDFSFSGYQANVPNAPLPGPRVDIELDRIAATADADAANNSAQFAAITAKLARAGASAYQLALLNGFVGTETQYLASLVSTVPGPPGPGITDPLTGNGGLLSVTPTGDTTSKSLANLLGERLKTGLLFPALGAIAVIAPGLAIQGTANKFTYGGYRITNDQVAQISNGSTIGPKVDGFQILHEFGGGPTQGGRHAIEGVLLHTAPSHASNTDNNYVGVQGQSQSINGDGGTAGSFRGQYFGLSASTIINKNATFVYNATGAEFNTITVPGCSLLIRQGIQVADTIGVRGSAIDCAIGISCAQGSTLTNQVGIFFGAQNGAPALGPDSTAIYLNGSAIPQLGIFLDAPNVRFLTALIRSPFVVLTEQSLQMAFANASIILGNSAAANTPVIDFQTGSGSAYGVRLLASGGSATAGNGVLTIASSILIPPALTRPASRYGASLGAPNFEFNGVYVQNLSLQTQPTFAPTTPGQTTFASPSNTALVISKMGSDSVVRSVTLTLA